MNQSHGFIDTVVQLNNFPKERYNVLIPVTSMQVMSNMQKILVNEVSLNTDAKEGGDIYFEKSSSKYAITKVGGMKLAAAANISVVSSESVTPDVCVRCMSMSKAVGSVQPCGTCPHAYDVKYVVKLRVPEPSGNFRIIEKHKEIDCQIEKSGMTETQFKRFLPHRASIAESKAFMRSLRDSLGLKAGYTIDELKKPFIIAHIVPNLDAPEIRERLASSYLSSMGMLFEMSPGQKQIAASATPESQERPELPPVEENFNEGAMQDLYGDDDDANGAQLPWDDDAPDGIWCEECQNEIIETQGRGGQRWTPEMIKGYSEKTFGRCLCTECQKKSSKGGNRR